MLGGKYILRKKLQHKDSRVRLEALGKLSLDNQDLIAECAANDPDSEVRKAAIDKLDDCQLLEKLMISEGAQEVRHFLRVKLDKIYIGRIMGDEEKIDSRLLIDKISSEELLSSLVCNAESADVRAAAAEKITTPEHMLTVLDRTGDSALALKMLARFADDPNALRQLADSACSHEVRKAAMERLAEMEDISAVPDAGHSETVKTPHAGISDKLKHILHEREDLCKKIEALCGETGEASNKEFEKYRENWSDLTPAPPEYQELLEKRFADACKAFEDAAEAAREKARNRIEKIDKLEELCAQVARMLAETDGGNRRKKLKRVREEWEKCARDVADIDALERTFLAGCKSLEERIEEQSQAAKGRVEILQKCCSELEEIIAQNSLDQFNERRKELELEVERAAGDKQDHEIRELVQHFHRLCKSYSFKLHQLYQTRDLARWEHYTLKTDLCKEAEELLKADYDKTPAVARRLKDLRYAWKKIGSVPHEKAEEIWERFKIACDQLQQRIGKYYDELEGKREQISSDKIRLCEEAEAIQDSTDWEEAADKFKKLQMTWKDVGFTHPEKERELYKRFRAACDTFFNARKDHYTNIRSQRDQAAEIKRKLCDEAEDLFKLSYGEAHRRIPGLWSRWKKAGPAGKDDKALYDRFRGIFDTYYEDLRKQRVENLELKKQLLIELEALAVSVEESEVIPEDFRGQYKDILRKWDEIGPMPRADEKPVFTAYNEAVGKINHKLGAARRQKEQSVLDAHLEVETLVSRLLHSCVENDCEAVRATLKEWDALEMHGKGCFEKFVSQINDAVEKDEALPCRQLMEQAASNLRNRKMICLELEKLCGGTEDSSEEVSADKLAEELSMAIASNFTARQEKEVLSTGKVKELTERFIDGGFVIQEELNPLYERFSNALDATEAKLC
jgi:hypothetical protein